MAILAVYFKVLAGQREIAQVVVEGSFLPVERSMAGSTFGTKATVVRIILEMARGTVRGCALEYVVLMAGFTAYPGMLTLQLEGGQAVVEGNFLPAVWRVTGVTCRAKAQSMRIVRVVARETVLRSSPEIDQAPRIHMAKYTFNLPVPAGQPERMDLMVIPFTKPVEAVMAGQAV